LTRLSSADTFRERTEVLHGKQNVVDTVIQFTSKTKSKIDACVDNTRPSLVIGIEQLRKAFVDAKNRGVRLLLQAYMRKESQHRKLSIVM
jgi:hypothetical protein